jgi:hypothetical protein
MSYTLCPRCGQKALSVATQCPRCGNPFELHHLYDAPGPRSRLRPVAFALAALGLIYLGVDVLKREPDSANGGFETPILAADPIPQPLPEPWVPAPSEPLPAAAEPATGPAPEHPATALAAPARAPKAAPASPQQRRYTTIWANVREARRPLAPVVTVLQPGEPVLVDSLSNEWYRVVEDGQKLGYVYRELVDTAPPVFRN